MDYGPWILIWFQSSCLSEKAIRIFFPREMLESRGHEGRQRGSCHSFEQWRFQTTAKTGTTRETHTQSESGP